MRNGYKLSLAAIAASLVLVGCGAVDDIVNSFDPGEDGDDYTPALVTGQFVDTYVKGLNYTCIEMLNNVEGPVTGTGITNEKGEYTCNEGYEVEFSLGTYVIGSDRALGGITSPYTLSLGSQEAYINLAQLLQTLDDGTTEGALTIPENFSALNDVTLKLDDPDFDALMADVLNVTSLVDPVVAQAHLDETLVSLAPAPAPAPADPGVSSLESFVSGKNLTIGAEIIATFATGGYYEENYPDGSGCYEGTWAVSASDRIAINCAGPAEWIFIGELKEGMTVTFYAPGDEHDGYSGTVSISDAVNPDAI